MAKIDTSSKVRDYTYEMFSKSLETYRKWFLAGFDFGLFIRIEDGICADHDLPNQLIDIVTKNSVAASRITLVFNDSIMDDAAETLALFTRLRIKGFKLAVRTASSTTESLSPLLKLPIDEIQLDSVLISGVRRDMETEFAISTFVLEAQKNNIKTSAIGIDNVSTFNFCYDAGCADGQGRFFSDLLTAKQVVDFAQGKQLSDAADEIVELAPS